MLRRTLDQRIRIEVECRRRICRRAAPIRASSSRRCSTSRSMRATPCRRAGACAFAPSLRRALPRERRAPSVEADERRTRLRRHRRSPTPASACRRRSGSAPSSPSSPPRRPGRGTGLGLSTVYGFVKQSQGRGDARERAGAGTTVTLYLPRAAATRPRRRATTTARRRRVPPGLRVLLVEDDPEVRDVDAPLPRDARLRVTRRPSGEQALLALADGGDFDLLLSDIALGPGMRGTELARRARQAHSPELAIAADVGLFVRAAARRRPRRRRRLGAAAQALRARGAGARHRPRRRAGRRAAAEPLAYCSVRAPAPGSAGRIRPAPRPRRCGCRAGPSRRSAISPSLAPAATARGSPSRASCRGSCRSRRASCAR